jgi:hypothetical protein
MEVPKGWFDRERTSVGLGRRESKFLTICVSHNCARSRGSLADGRPSLYLDFENSKDRAKLAESESFLARHEDKWVILDEICRVPELFFTLPGIIDKDRREGRRTGRFLLLGSPAIELMRQSETLG